MNSCYHTKHPQTEKRSRSPHQSAQELEGSELRPEVRRESLSIAGRCRSKRQESPDLDTVAFSRCSRWTGGQDHPREESFDKQSESIFRADESDNVQVTHLRRGESSLQFLIKLIRTRVVGDASVGMSGAGRSALSQGG